MLVLSRKVGERLVIGDGIVVVVKRIAGQRVTFGIEAPPDVRIVRGELKVFDTPRTVNAPRDPGSDSIPMLMAPVMTAESMPMKPR
jgi:carbon storage regulator